MIFFEEYVTFKSSEQYKIEYKKTTTVYTVNSMNNLNSMNTLNRWTTNLDILNRIRG
jgi:hypothetical protein